MMEKRGKRYYRHFEKEIAAFRSFLMRMAGELD